VEKMARITARGTVCAAAHEEAENKYRKKRIGVLPGTLTMRYTQRGSVDNGHEEIKKIQETVGST
jgi:hypothetical protein